jgi:hypothetical protein
MNNFLPVKDGGGKGTRTPDLRDANASLSQLSYTPNLTRWWAKEDLNL